MAPLPAGRPPLGGTPLLPRTPRSSLPTADEASAWADVLVHRRLLHTAVLAPTGQWLVQHTANGPVHVLDDPADIVELAAAIQHAIRSARPETR
ncbi:hypothetical protein HCK00_23325 [Streptomyces sp. PLAI1-29]|uniref:Uncharacterized protein n=1 Tax=Streptomyces zingiberis TaxID=2053010 RepID=A0ABX1C0D4_9ACTN|nr:hypothetical protein [Streptomyces zingiberis]